MSLWAPAAVNLAPPEIGDHWTPHPVALLSGFFPPLSIDYSPSDCILDAYLLRLSLNSK